MKTSFCNFQATKYLFKAVQDGNLKQVKMLLDAGTDLSKTDDSGNSIATVTLTEMDKKSCYTCNNMYSILIYLMYKGAGRYMKTQELKDVYEALRKYPSRLKRCKLCSSEGSQERKKRESLHINHIAVESHTISSCTDVRELRQTASGKHTEKSVYTCGDLFVRKEYIEHIDGKNNEKPKRRHTYCLIPSLPRVKLGSSSSDGSDLVEDIGHCEK